MSNHEVQIQNVAAQQMGWNAADVVVEPITEIGLSAGSFYAASHRTHPIDGAMTYAVLPSGEVIGEASAAAIDAIAANCQAEGANAKSWAELMVRFDARVGPGRVLYAPPPPISVGDAPDARIHAPLLEGETLSFFTHNMHTARTYVVTANVAGGKVSDVVKQRHV